MKFAPTVAAATQPGELAEPVLELASSTRFAVDAVVVVQRGPGTEPVIELWRFDQYNADGDLARVGEPVSLLRTHVAAPRADALKTLRLRLSEPGTTMRRRLGIEAASPASALELLGAAAKSVRDAAATDAARVEAMVTVFAGLDDGPLFDTDALGTALAGLAADDWVAVETEMPSEFRARVRTRSGEALEMLRKGDGWVVAAIRPS